MKIFFRKHFSYLLKEFTQKLVHSLTCWVHGAIEAILIFTIVVITSKMKKQYCRRVLQRRDKLPRPCINLTVIFNPRHYIKNYQIIDTKFGTYSVSNPGCPDSNERVCPGVSNSGTTLIPLSLAYSMMSATSFWLYTAAVSCHAPCLLK